VSYCPSASKNDKTAVTDSLAAIDVSPTNRRKREETLVQGKKAMYEMLAAVAKDSIRTCTTPSSQRTK
jgi:hypothetical protein